MHWWGWDHIHPRAYPRRYLGGSLHAQPGDARNRAHAVSSSGRGPGDPSRAYHPGGVPARGGYTTFGTGKWHNGCASFARSFSAGDEIFFNGMWDHWNVPTYHFDPGGEYAARTPYTTEFFQSNQVALPGLRSYPARRALDRFVYRDGDGFHPEIRPAQPVLAYVSLMAPHDPRTMPRRYQEMYPAESISLPANFQPEHRSIPATCAYAMSCWRHFPATRMRSSAILPNTMP